MLIRSGSMAPISQWCWIYNFRKLKSGISWKTMPRLLCNFFITKDLKTKPGIFLIDKISIWSPALKAIFPITSKTTISNLSYFLTNHKSDSIAVSLETTPINYTATIYPRTSSTSRSAWIRSSAPPALPTVSMTNKSGKFITTYTRGIVWKSGWTLSILTRSKILPIGTPLSNLLIASYFGNSRQIPPSSPPISISNNPFSCQTHPSGASIK